ncbi:cell wall glucanase [Exophiala viscosa]|uniref:Cell wall glucanase n=1 Tax=Exophiala viscosa TaxID=2486360 RepID=A0AAN6DW05_9EURO|nr:cell wall glucanase [Exophiala viscosa]KAI1625570.1 cell wall glucanase [Exophiala viscosa]
MKPILFSLAALCAQVGLAVPHGGNQHQVHRHAQRDVTQTSTITDVVTITAPNAVVWVDQYGNVISTEYRSSTTATTSSTSVASPTTTTSSTPTSTSAQAASSTYTSSAAATTSTGSTSSSALSTTVSTTSRVADSTTAASTTASSSDNDRTTSSNDTSTAGSGFGICYDYITTAGCKTLAEMNTDFAYLASQGFSTVRTYDIGCPLGDVASAASTAGLQLIAGLNTIDNVATDIATLIGMFDGNWDSVNTIVIGNEVVNDGGSAAAVVAALATARPLLTAAGFTKNVVTVDVWSAIIDNPELCENSDYCAANCHAFFDADTVAADAGTYVSGCVSKISALGLGKSIVITESGWPYQGDANGDAVPSVANQETAISALRSAFSSNPGGLFLFEAYDATYKQPGSLGVEQYFGIYGH